MKIAMFVGPFPKPSETFILGQITGLIARGHEVDIYGLYREEEGFALPEVVRFDLMARTTFLRFRQGGAGAQLARCIRAIAGRAVAPRTVAHALNLFKHGREALTLRLLQEALQVGGRAYDILHCQFGTLLPVAFRLRRMGAISGRIVASFRGFDLTRKLRVDPLIYENIFPHVDLFMPVSRSLERILLRNGADPERIAVHPSGIDCRRFPLSERAIEPGGTVRLITVARLTEKKGIGYALDAVARVIGTGRRVEYQIVGDGELRGELEAQAGRMGLGSRVQFLGWQSHSRVGDLLREAHVLIAPSITAAHGDQEGIPNSIKEAMCTGMPVVGTRHGGIPELVEDGVSGFLVPERDADALAARLDLLLDIPERWPAMGRAGRQKIEKEFDAERLNDRLVELYQNVVGGKSAQEDCGQPMRGFTWA
jgi:colanic acid/amylovoran biosynthesis glycosyltransferase